MTMMLRVTADGEVSRVDVNGLEDMYPLVSPAGRMIDVVSTHNGDESTGLDLIVDQEGLIHQPTRPNAVATMLAGYHLMGQYIVGDALICGHDEEGGFIAVVDPEEVVLRLLAEALKAAMFT